MTIIEYFFRNVEINVYVNGVKNQGSDENFVKQKTLLNRNFVREKFDCIYY